ncbi:hypothetical protein H0H87_007873 [Tephrocybe sp. NHM501043]|nr:hypothetical protein H0H87_007873 [Tephrocybe sp. NHM501043]
MSNLITKFGDEFLYILKLDVAGVNWVIYKDWFLWSSDAQGYLEHLGGTAKGPTNPVMDCGRLKPIPTPTEGTEGSMSTIMRPKQLTPADIILDAEWKKNLKIWKQEEAIVKQQIAGTIPNLLFMKIHSFGSVQHIWEVLARDFEKKSQMVSVDLM